MPKNGRNTIEVLIIVALIILLLSLLVPHFFNDDAKNAIDLMDGIKINNSIVIN